MPPSFGFEKKQKASSAQASYIGKALDMIYDKFKLSKKEDPGLNTSSAKPPPGEAQLSYPGYAKFRPCSTTRRVEQPTQARQPGPVEVTPPAAVKSDAPPASSIKAAPAINSPRIMAVPDYPVRSGPRIEPVTRTVDGKPLKF
jgi:hypothetical protein